MSEIPLPLIVEARKCLTRCWVWTLLNSLILLLPMSTVGILGILLTPYLGWSLYWGWQPVWSWWRDTSGGMFFVTSNPWLFLLLVFIGLEILALIAIVYGGMTHSRTCRQRATRRITTSCGRKASLGHRGSYCAKNTGFAAFPLSGLIRINVLIDKLSPSLSYKGREALCKRG